MSKFWLLNLVAIFVAACGGGSGAGSIDEPPRPAVLFDLDIKVDGEKAASMTEQDAPMRIDDDRIIIASTPLLFELQLENAAENTDCSVGGTAMKSLPDSKYVVEIQAAYFEEDIRIACQSGSSTDVEALVKVVASDPQLDLAVQRYLDTRIRKSSNFAPSDPYSGYRVPSYYGEIHRLIMGAEIYKNPELFGVERSSEQYEGIEAYLINTSESFFEPCVDYDFDTGPLRQCRSPDRVGKYYLWRSPLNDGTNIRTTHGKVEWRGGAGIAQAIKALILEHADENTEVCPISDEPSAIRDATLICRALNVRRLLYEELWQKWSDVDWVSSLGYSFQFTIQGADVSHYISWNELIVDLFNDTAQIVLDQDCAGCEQPIVAESRMDDLLEFSNVFGDGYVTFSCKLPHIEVGCNFLGNELQVTKSADIGHLNTLMHLLTMNNADEICTGDRRICVAISDIVRTMNEQSWVESIPNVEAAVGFPKFDLFFNGYCSRAYDNPLDPLQEFCNYYWRTEEGNWPSHKSLFGFVNLGRYDRDLMIKLRQAADENDDDVITLDDTYHLEFVITLYAAMKKNG